MTSRGRNFNNTNEWDANDDYNDSQYEQQYPDDNIASSTVNLDHCRLYITNIPRGLNDEGLRTAFSKFGTLVEVYLSKDPSKKYGLVRYETPGEAKSAMMNMNRTEPLKLNINIAHKAGRKGDDRPRKDWQGEDRPHKDWQGDERPRKDCQGDDRPRKDWQGDDRPRKDWQNRSSTNTGRNSNVDDSGSVDTKARGSRVQDPPVTDTMTNGNNTDELLEDDYGFSDILDPKLTLELETLKMEQLKVKEEQLQCKSRMLMLQRVEKRPLGHSAASNRCILPDGKIIVRNIGDRGDLDFNHSAGAGDSNETTICCSCKGKAKNSWDPQADGSSTPSTCVLCSEDQSDNKNRDKSITSKVTDKKSEFSIKIVDSKTEARTNSKTTKKSDCSKLTESVSKKSDATSKKEIKRCGKCRSEVTCDLKYSDFYTDSDDEDETNRLIQLRNADYVDIVDEDLKLVIAIAGYPKSKMRLRQMEQFQRSLTEVIDMQLKAGILKRVPSFLDYYLNRGALVCICKNCETRDWMVRVCPRLQERMHNNLVLLKAKVKRLCLAVLKIPRRCWPATAQDAFKLLQYFNPTLKTNLWKIYAQKLVDDVEYTSFLIDRVSGEMIRGPAFKNVIDYSQMEFELTGYTEIYYECLLFGMEEDLRSVGSRVKALAEMRSTDTTPRPTSVVNVKPGDITKNPEPEHKAVVKCLPNASIELTESEDIINANIELETNFQKDILSKLKDVKYISEKDEILVWSEEINNNYEGIDIDAGKCTESKEQDVLKIENNIASTSGVAMSDKTESFIESNDNLISRSSNLNIDSNRGIAYHRRTNYLHVEPELKVAITLEGYPQNKLEGTHIRRLKHLFKEYLHKDLKMQRFPNLIIPKFQDIYLSNGAVIYICDSLETKDYLTEVLPKFINSTGLKLTFRDIKSLVRYTRIVMRLPKDHAHVESLEILMKLQSRYPGLKPDCWKYYSDVAGKQKRQFGVDPESLEVIKSPDFEPMYQGDKLTFRIIDRQKRDVSFEEVRIDTDNRDTKKQRDAVFKNMYVPLDPEIMAAPLTRIRTNHYSDLIADDLKLYVGPANYPESRVEEVLFHSIKRTLENIVLEALEKDEINDETMPKFHDMYLFDGVIFIICGNMLSRNWIEQALTTVNTKLHIHLKSTEFRGAVGIISMYVKTEKDTNDVITILQQQNPRLRTKYWRKISTVRTKTKLDVVLQIDKLSAQVITSPNFNPLIGSNAVQFKLGHLQSLLKPKSSLEALSKIQATRLESINSEVVVERSKSKVSIQLTTKSLEDLKSELKKDLSELNSEPWSIIDEHLQTSNTSDLEHDITAQMKREELNLDMDDQKELLYTENKIDCDLDPVIIEPDSPRSAELNLPTDQQRYHKLILKIPLNIMPENKDDLNIIFDLLEEKNPGLNTELWQIFTETAYPSNGKFTIYIDKQSVSVLQGKNFDPSIGGEKLKFYF